MSEYSDHPSADEVSEYLTRLSNWGRWGDDDVLGTFNHVTTETRQAALALATQGDVVSCAWDVAATANQDQLYGTAQRSMIESGEGAARKVADGTQREMSSVEHVGMTFHGWHITHLDALSHIFWDGFMYNNRPAHEVTTREGATSHAITEVREGLLTRGVLVDLPAIRGVDWVESGDGARPSDLAEFERRYDVEVRQGDAVLLRTGYGRRRILHGREDLRNNGHPGWHASCLPWLFDRSVAAIGCDTAQDVVPSGYPQFRGPIHVVGVVAMGLWLIDNCNLEELAAHCEATGRWEFMLVVSPIPMVGATGSAVNPLAVF